jgi:hypothetical protein
MRRQQEELARQQELVRQQELAVARMPPSKPMRYEQQQALSRLVRLVMRRHTGTVLPTDDRVLDRLRAVIGDDPPMFEKLCAEIATMVDQGYIWNSRWRGWRHSSEPPTRGRPPSPGFKAAWRIARDILTRSLSHEPALIEVADYLRRNRALRQMAEVERTTKARSLVRRYQRRQ